MTRSVNLAYKKRIGNSFVGDHSEVALFEPAKIPGRRLRCGGRSAGGENVEGVDLALAESHGRNQVECGHEKSLQHHRASDALSGRDALQQLLRVWHGKGGPLQECDPLSHFPLEGEGERAGGQAPDFTLEELQQLSPLEERIYRHRCVEAWSIVVPWIGYSFNALLKEVSPQPKAKFVAFESFYDPGQMPMASYAGISFPYIEGLRLDEAMHPLALLCFGMYGETLPNQDGAPMRMVLPWKYGFKSIKSLVKIKLVERQPDTTWNMANSREYGFYSNVNPNVDHPRWSQAKERRLGEFFRRSTLMFNGYDQVASLYAGMDLRKYF